MFLGKVGGGGSWSRSIWSSSGQCLLAIASAAALALVTKDEGIHAGMEEEDEEEAEREGWEVMVKWSNFWARDSILKD